jgi:ParB/RepB/Spo0J family partition protein
LTIKKIPIEQVFDNPYNPRSKYDDEKTQELASSIEQIGLLEVPKARQVAEDRYELAYGGYRRRAYVLLAQKDPEKWGKMPLDVIKIDQPSLLIYALEENLKRQNMTPMDTAKAVARYFEAFPDTKEEELATKLSMAQSTISNMRRVARLPEEILKYIDDQVLSFSQARELCALADIDGVTRGRIESKVLMLEAVTLLGTEGVPATVIGMKQAIHKVVAGRFIALEDRAAEGPLFDTADCEKCEKSIKTTPFEGRSVLHCLDAQCFGLKQAPARRKLEEEVAEEEKKRQAMAAEADRLAAERAAKRKAEEEKIPRGITPPPPVEIKVKLERLIQGGDVFDSYSGYSVFNESRLADPFEEAGVRYVSTGDVEGSPDAKKCYRIVPRAEYNLEIRTLTPPKGVNKEAHLAAIRSDPLGPYNGAAGSYKGEEFVLVGPPVVFAPEPEQAAPATRTRKPKEVSADERKSEVEETPEVQPAGVPGESATLEAPGVSEEEAEVARFTVTCTLTVSITDPGLSREAMEAKAIALFTDRIKAGDVPRDAFEFVEDL